MDISSSVLIMSELVKAENFYIARILYERKMVRYEKIIDGILKGNILSKNEVGKRFVVSSLS